MGVDANGNSFDFTTKLLHLAWHPTENSIACAAANSLYMYYAWNNMRPALPCPVLTNFWLPNSDLHGFLFLIEESKQPLTQNMVQGSKPLFFRSQLPALPFDSFYLIFFFLTITLHQKDSWFSLVFIMLLGWVGLKPG